jgi:hypothetical protein
MILTNNVVRGAVVAMLLSISSVGWAEDPASAKLVPRERPAVSVDNWSYRSASMERTYDISVGLPLSYEAEPEKSWPAIIVLDGNRAFGMALDIARGLVGSGEVEDVFIVSIGTPYEEGSEAWTRRRVHEFSPDNEWPLTDPFGKFRPPDMSAPSLLHAES